MFFPVTLKNLTKYLKLGAFNNCHMITEILKYWQYINNGVTKPLNQSLKSYERKGGKKESQI